MPPVISNSIILGLSQFAMSILQKWIGTLIKISLPGVGINTRLLPVVTFSLTNKLNYLPSRGGGDIVIPISRENRHVRAFRAKGQLCVQSNTSIHHNGQLRGKVRWADSHCGYDYS